MAWKWTGGKFEPQGCSVCGVSLGDRRADCFTCSPRCRMKASRVRAAKGVSNNGRKPAAEKRGAKVKHSHKGKKRRA
jgi:hypothetical protein